MLKQYLLQEIKNLPTCTLLNPVARERLVVSVWHDAWEIWPANLFLLFFLLALNGTSIFLTLASLNARVRKLSPVRLKSIVYIFLTLPTAASPNHYLVLTEDNFVMPDVVEVASSLLNAQKGTPRYVVGFSSITQWASFACDISQILLYAFFRLTTRLCFPDVVYWLKN